jgi:hypothetical protein
MYIENEFRTYEAAKGYCGRIRGIETEVIEKRYNGKNWQATESVVLPLEGEITFTYAVCGEDNTYTKFVATPSGVRPL